MEHAVRSTPWGAQTRVVARERAGKCVAARAMGAGDLRRRNLPQRSLGTGKQAARATMDGAELKVRLRLRVSRGRDGCAARTVDAVIARTLLLPCPRRWPVSAPAVSDSAREDQRARVCAPHGLADRG